jgi:hypothetical protein
MRRRAPVSWWTIPRRCTASELIRPRVELRRRKRRSTR